MIFASDNWAGAAPRVAEALTRANGGYAPGYGSDDLTAKVEARFSEIFERDVAVFYVGTGTAANALALSSVMKVGGYLLAHEDAHVQADEAGAPEFFSGGRIRTLKGEMGKIAASTLEAALAGVHLPDLHAGRPVAVGITQLTEWGAAYTPAEISEISAISHGRGLKVLMDGARFTNALAALGCTPAEMTWKAGVDILSFGGTKNGCWCAEAVVMFDKAGAEDFIYARKRSGQLFSKSRFISAQFDGYFEDDGWLKDARHANAMAARLAEGINRSGSGRLAFRPEANEVFAIWSKATSAQLRSAGAMFYEWPATNLVCSQPPGPDENLIRLVTSFETTEAEVDRFVAVLGASG